MKKILPLFVLLLSALTTFSQTVTLTFTGRDANNQHLPMNRVVIANATQGWQETIYYPDTVFTMGGTGIADNAANGDFGLRQNNPNPFNGTTEATLNVAGAGEVVMELADVNGRIVETWCTASLQPGNHQFRINVSVAGIYFLTARQNGQTSSIKMVNNGQGATNKIEYRDFVNANNMVETRCTTSLQKNNSKGVATHPFALGDDMIYTGYVTVGGTEYQSQMIHQNQFVSETFVLNFNVSAPTGLATVTTDAATNVLGHTATCGGNVTDDGGYSVIARGVCWSTSPNPVFNDSHVSCGDGMGAFSGQLTGLEANTTYYVRAYAVNSVGTAYGNQESFTTATVAPVDGQPCPGAPTVTDHQGNIYNTVQIGSQCWTRENMRCTTFPSTGTTILVEATPTGYSYTGKKAYYVDGSSSNTSTYGLLYNWNAAVDTFNTAYGETSTNTDYNNAVNVTFSGHRRGICPTGWHVPSDAEWTQLTTYVSGQSEYVCGSSNDNIAKALASTTGWDSSSGTCAVGNNPSGNNATGFYAVPAGNSDYFCYGFGNGAGFWSATQYNSGVAYTRSLYSNGVRVDRSYGNKYGGYSVRCLRDEAGGSTASLPTVTTSPVTDITETTAACGGNVTADGGASVTARGVCWSTDANPTIDGSHTTDGTGMGSFTSSITGLSPNTTYYVRAYAVNSVGTAYGNQVSFTTTDASVDGQPCPGTPTVTDVDNNTYNTVQIGNQCWMKENLKTMHYSSGIPISLVGISSPSTYEIAYCYFPNGQESNVSTYGYLYNWPAVMGNFTSSESNPSGVQGICPTGWHVPSDAEWRQLTDYVSSQNEYVCGSDSTYIAKALASPTGWRSTTEQCVPGNNPSSNNATGFSAVPAGHCGGLAYGDFGARTKFWSATQISNDEAYFCELCYLGEFVVRSGNLKEDYGYSVRCLRDEGGSSATLPAVTTTLVTSITQNSATSGGNVISNGGATVTIRGVCWSTSLNPTIADSHTTDGSGMGSFTSSMTSLTANTTYYVRAYVVNSAGTAYGSQKIFTTVDSSSFTCGTSRLTDYDNNTYNTVRIGSQCWMKENLRTTHYADGTFISLGSSMSTTTPYRYYPDNSSSNVSSYGYLYNWKAVMGNSSSSSSNPSGVQGICPTGWHVPSDAEWTQLTDYVSSVSEYACGCFYPFIAKALASTTGWYSDNSTCAVGNNPSTNNDTGFSAVPAGNFSDSYNDFGSCTYFWSATQYNYTCYRYLRYDYANVYRDYHYKGLGYSVRCLRD